MDERLLWTLALFVLCGCKAAPNPGAAPVADSDPVVRLTAQDDYAQYIGQRVEVIGVVTLTKQPYVCGIRASELGSHGGRRVRLRGTLRESVVTQESVDRMRDSGITLDGLDVGRFFSLDGLEFEVLP